MHVCKVCKKIYCQPWQVDNSGAFHFSVIKTADVSDFKGHYGITEPLSTHSLLIKKKTKIKNNLRWNS